MKSFQELARKNLSEKFQGFRMLWTLAIDAVKHYFQIEKKADQIISEETITGYLKNQILFLHTSDQFLKIEIFKQKMKLMQTINNKFQALGYQHKIKDIRLK